MSKLAKLSTVATVALILSLSASEAMPWGNRHMNGLWQVSGVDRHDHLNVRAGPGVRFPVVRELRPRARNLEKLVCTPTVKRRQFFNLSPRVREILTGMPTWCLMTRNGRQIGWVNARFLSR